MPHHRPTPQDRDAQEHAALDGERPDRKHSPLDEPPNFSEKDYRISPADARGHVERVWVRLPPYLVRLVQTLVSKGPYPWETPSDAYRCAIYWGLRLLKHNPPETMTVFAQVQAMNDILTREADLIAFRAVFDRATDILNEYQREGAIDEARRTLGELDARINQMPEGYWKRKYGAMLRTRFGPLMRGERMTLMEPSPAGKLRAVMGQGEDEPFEDPDGHITSQGE